jgi:hypothetical protein
MQALAANGLTVKEEHRPQLLEKCVELKDGQVSLIDWGKFISAYCAYYSSAGLALTVPPAAIALLTYELAVHSLMKDISAREESVIAKSEAAKLSARYLSSLVTVDNNLAPETIKTVVAVQEVLERRFDDHEVTYLQADSLAIKEFLREDILPFVVKLKDIPPVRAPTEFIRTKRAEVKAKVELQRKTVHVFLQRIEDGIMNMGEDTYSIRTNHIPRYAAAISLEVLLKAYYSFLGNFDSQNIMSDHDWKTLLETATQGYDSIRNILDKYAEERGSLITTTRYKRL